MSIPLRPEIIQADLRQRPGLIVISGDKDVKKEVQFRFFPVGYKYYLRFEQGAVELERQLRTFLQSQRLSGLKKESLREAANARFERSIPFRTFDAAYKVVFQSKRGRPKK